METTYSNLASRLLLRTTFQLPNISSFRIAELEIYPSDDPYTHGHPSQISVGPNYFYFHRASAKAEAKFRGGTFKGLDLTFSYKGHRGGALIRSIIVDGAVIEGPCKIVNWLLDQAGVKTILEFIGRVLGDNLDVSEYLKENKCSSDILRGPRFGLSYPVSPVKKETFYRPLRFMTLEAFHSVKKGKYFIVVSPYNSNVDFEALKSYKEWAKYFQKDYLNNGIAPKGTDGLLSAYGTFIRYGWSE